MAKTVINYNGSRYAGGRPAPISALLELLRIERAELCQVKRLPEPGMFVMFGNFEKIAHAFSIETDDPELLREFKAARRASRAIVDSSDYKFDQKTWELMSSTIPADDETEEQS